MLLVIEVGNTNTKLGLYSGDELVAHWRVVTGKYETLDEFRMLIATLLHHDGLDKASITGCCISSVVPQFNQALDTACTAVFGQPPLFVGPGVKTGLTIHVENPKEVGADRICSAVGALDDHEPPLIVLDFGTATTFDAIFEGNEYRGGVIVPGLEISAAALFEKCAKLPKVDIAIPPNVIGRDTVTNIRSGLTYGYAGLVDGIVNRMEKEMGGKATVIASGGFAPLMTEVSDTIQHVDDLLTLKGLRAIYERNQRA